MKLILTLGVLIVGCVAATYDEALTTSVKANVDRSSLLLSFTKVKPPRLSAALDRQVLFSIAFHGRHRLSIILDRVHGKVVIETSMTGEIEKQTIPAEVVGPQNDLDQVLVELRQNTPGTATVYIGCHAAGYVNLPMTPKQMAESDEVFKVYRDRHADVSLDVDLPVTDLLKKLGCPEPSMQADSNIQAASNQVYTYRRALQDSTPGNTTQVMARVILSTYNRPQELIRPKEGLVNWTPGDIPVQHEDDKPSLLIRTLSELIETIKELQIEVQTQREETALLRDALINCEACKPGMGRRGL